MATNTGAEQPRRIAIEEPSGPRKPKAVAVRLNQPLIFGAEMSSAFRAGKTTALEFVGNGLIMKDLRENGKSFLIPFANIANVEIVEP